MLISAIKEKSSYLPNLHMPRSSTRNAYKVKNQFKIHIYIINLLNIIFLATSSMYNNFSIKNNNSKSSIFIT